MISATRQAALHANGPRSAGRPSLCVFWYTVLEAKDGDTAGDTAFHVAEIRIGDADFTLDTWGALEGWLAALNAVIAAVEA